MEKKENVSHQVTPTAHEEGKRLHRIYNPGKTVRSQHINIILSMGTAFEPVFVIWWHLEVRQRNAYVILKLHLEYIWKFDVKSCFCTIKVIHE